MSVEKRQRHYEVTMHRRKCLNESQAIRKCIAYVEATSPEEACKIAERRTDKQAFKSISAREARP